MSNNLFSIASSDAKSVCKKESTLEENVITAMREMRNHWLLTNEDAQFRAAIGGVMLFYGSSSPEYECLELEVSSIRKWNAMLGALQEGIPIDLEAMATEAEPKFKPIGLSGLWNKTK